MNPISSLPTEYSPPIPQFRHRCSPLCPVLHSLTIPFIIILSIQTWRILEQTQWIVNHAKAKRVNSKPFMLDIRVIIWCTPWTTYMTTFEVEKDLGIQIDKDLIFHCRCDVERQRCRQHLVTYTRKEQTLQLQNCRRLKLTTRRRCR